MNASETARIRVTSVQRAVVYDCDTERAARVGAILEALELQPLLVDLAALMRAVIQSSATHPALLIGDVADALDWRELGAALREQLGDVPVIAYGSDSAAEQVIAAVGSSRVVRLPFPFKQDALASALRVPAAAALAEAPIINLPTGQSPAVREVVGLIRQVAAHDSSVLILGESGTGKELAARAIHEASPRRQRPFVAINCGAIPSELLESELFGHEKGAFTGAVTARKGRFEIAEGGTLFLDEIGDMSLPMQVKLLRVLQERVFERVGNHTQIRCNVRIIAATHRNLEDSIRRAAFREDLFYRLNVFPIEMPALRTRLEDLPALVHEFAERNLAEGRGRLQLTQRALQALERYQWPGNVRELANLIERLSILCADRRCDLTDLPPKYRPADAVADLLQAAEGLEPATSVGVARAMSEPATSPATSKLAMSKLAMSKLAMSKPAMSKREPTGPESEGADEREALTMLTRNEPAAALAQLPPQGLDLREHLYRIERDLIHQALSRSGGTVAHAARLLGLRRTTLVEKLRKFEMLNETAVTEV